MIGFEIPEILQQLFESILKLKGTGEVWDWLQSHDLGYFAESGSGDREDQETWLSEHLVQELDAYAIRHGIEKLIVELFPTRADLDNLAEKWLEPNEYESFVKADPCTAGTLLQVKPLLSELFRVYNYGLENLIDKVDDLFGLLEYYQHQPYEQIDPQAYRGLGMNPLNDLETLLKVMLLFYWSCLRGKDELLDQAFSAALEKCKGGLGPTLTAITWINDFFETGETKSQRKERTQRFQIEKAQLEAQIKNADSRLYENQNRLLKQLPALYEQSRTIDNQLVMLNEKDESQRTELNGKKQKIDVDIERVKKDSEREEEKWDKQKKAIKKEIGKRASVYAELIEKRADKAKQLQSQCREMLGRDTPFGKLDISTIHSVKDRYRNPLTHMPDKSLEKLIKVAGFKPVKELIQKLSKLLKHFKQEHLCPETYIILGSVLDIYGRSVVICAKLERKIHNMPYWSLENMKWVYRWQEVNSEFLPGKAYFMLPNSNDRILFAPACVASDKLFAQLDALLPKVTWDSNPERAEDMIDGKNAETD